MAAQVQSIKEVGAKLTVATDIGESLLGVAYLKMESQGLLSMVFWEKTPSLKGFLEWCAQPTRIICGCFTHTDRSNVGAEPLVELAGLGWITSIRERNGARRGDVGEVFWRETQAAGQTSEFGRLLLEFSFGPCKMSTLYGITPEKNIPAVRFMRHMAFQPFGPIPSLCCWNGEECGGFLSALTKERWLQRSNP